MRCSKGWRVHCHHTNITKDHTITTGTEPSCRTPIPERELQNNMSEPYPGIRQAISLLLVTALLSAVCSLPIAMLGTVVGIPLTAHPLALAVANLVAIGLVLKWGLGKVGASFFQVYPLTPVAQPLHLPMGFTIIGVGILLSELDNLLRLALPVPASFASQLVDLMTGDSSLLGSLFLAVVVAPVTEELLFRGLILQGFLRRYSPRKAILASALLFAAFHGNPWQFFGALVLGILFAWWFVQTRSLIPCILGHALNNAVPLVLIGVLDVEIEGFTSDPTVLEFQPAWLNLIGLLCAGWGLSRLVQAFSGRGGDAEAGPGTTELPEDSRR